MRLFWMILFLLPVTIKAQLPDDVVMPNIRTVKLFMQNNQTGYPIITLGSINDLELHFDDMDGFVKNYSYSFQLCNADWSISNLSPFDFISGFTQTRINQYRQSSIAKTKYVHYQATLPDRNNRPSKSGNYLLKVFLNGDVNQVAFTRRVLVVDQKAGIGAQIQQPFGAEFFKTHQKVQFVVDRSKIDIVNPQQVKVVILQNFRWDNAKTDIKPTFIKGNTLEYNTENDALFPGGKEYRWIDLRSFRFASDRVEKNDLTTEPFTITVKPDPERSQQRYYFFRDINGFYETTTTDLINPWWQGDYAKVKFSFVPVDNQPYPDKKVYIAGEMTGYRYNDSTLMEYNADKGIYEKELFLKQGYYNYTYVTKDAKGNNVGVEQTDGNSLDTENTYTILVYYRSLAGRYDELIGVTTINSVNNRSGLKF